MEMAALYACLPDVVRLGVYLDNGLGVFFWSCVTMWLVGQGIGAFLHCCLTAVYFFYLPLLGVRAFDRWWIYCGW